MSEPSKSADGKKKGKRTPRIYPVLTLEEALKLGEAIHQHASGEKVNRLTLFKALNKSPTSSGGQILITSSGKYGITSGSFVAEYLDLTDIGKIATDPTASDSEKLKARFSLGIQGIEPFNVLYVKYKGKRLPSFEVMTDALKEAKLTVADPKECIDIFIVNCKFLNLLQTIAGSETLLPLEAVLEDLQKSSGGSPARSTSSAIQPPFVTEKSADRKVKWGNTCFYITPIGEEGSEFRKHSDLFLSSIVEPALAEFKLEVIRADKIGSSGMITTQILEHLVNSRLVVVDLSYHNPNVFYEMAIRHACKLPVVQICRKHDKIPFDVNQVRTVVIDTSDIYTLIPKMETYRAEISTHVRSALEGQESSNPITIFLPEYSLKLEKTASKSA